MLLCCLALYQVRRSNTNIWQKDKSVVDEVCTWPFNLKATFLSPLLMYLFGQNRQICPTDWRQFISAIASSSPVCGLIHPSDELSMVFSRCTQPNNSPNLHSLQVLQRECPVILTLLQIASHFPKMLLQPILTELLKKANAPFKVEEGSTEVTTSCNDENHELCYFPNHKEQGTTNTRGTYISDKSNKIKICIKQSTRHPTQLPGVFTFFCEHGKDCRLTLLWCSVWHYHIMTLPPFRDLLWLPGNESCGVS